MRKFLATVLTAAALSSGVTVATMNLVEDDTPKLEKTTCAQWTKPDKSDITYVTCYK